MDTTIYEMHTLKASTNCMAKKDEVNQRLTLIEQSSRGGLVVERHLPKQLSYLLTK